MPMILRWGIKAYPFSSDREEELRKAEWEEFKFSSQSSLEFVLQNLELYQSKAREALLGGKIIFLCVGPINKMLDFVTQENCALRELEKVVQVFYVGEGVKYPLEETEDFLEGEKGYEMKREEMDRITSLSWCDVLKFWDRIKYLWDELGGQGDNERTGQVRSMVLALISACNWGEMIRTLRQKEFMFTGQRMDMIIRKRSTEIGYQMFKEGNLISIVAVDEKGEMIIEKGEEEEHQKLMGEIKSEGFSNVLRNRWPNGIVRPEHHPRHPFFLKWERLSGVKCNACSCNISRDFLRFEYYISYRCSVCREYEMCEECFHQEENSCPIWAAFAKLQIGD